LYQPYPSSIKLVTLHTSLVKRRGSGLLDSLAA
jgi:hypothetical protein